VAAGVGVERAGVASGDVPAGGDCGDATAAGVALSGDAFAAGGDSTMVETTAGESSGLEGSPDDRDTQDGTETSYIIFAT